MQCTDFYQAVLVPGLSLPIKNSSAKEENQGHKCRCWTVITCSVRGLNVNKIFMEGNLLDYGN